MTKPFGDIFPEAIIQVSKRRKLLNQVFHEKDRVKIERIWFFVALLIFGLGFLIARLFNLTIIEGTNYRKLAQGNRIREVKITAGRGIIYDREGRALVRNIPTFISEATGDIRESIDREYIYGRLLAQTIGYTGEIGEEEFKIQNSKFKIHELELGDKIGKMGIEKEYDEILRGVNGKELKEVDALGKTVRVLGRIDPTAGESLRLSLDVSLQKIAAQEFLDKRGAVVVTRPDTGEVLALYSSPSFDPNDFVKGGEVEKILEAPDKPLFNRAIAGLYPPGSTFKIVTALAGLESGSIDKTTKIEDTGVINIGQYSFGNWYFSQYGKKEGLVDIVKAIKRSNDIFFYKTGEMVGIERLAAWAKKVGVGGKLGLDIPQEAEGIMPDPEWQKKRRGENWYLGNTYHVAIGQGDILTTPLQVNAWTNVIASGGKLCRPRLLSNLSNLCKDLGIKKETIELIREGIREACSPGGTGWPLFKFKIQNSKFKIDGIDFLETYEATASGKPMVEIPVACKTGTSEFGDPQGRTHAWFTVFAPVYNPQISVTVLVEAGGEGSNVAAPIAKKILEEWFGR